MIHSMMLLALLLGGLRALSQTVVIPAIGSGDTTMSYALVYDDGGENGAYSSTCNATYTFHTVAPNGRYKVTVQSYLTHPTGNACLQVFNGEGTDGYIIGSFPPSPGATYYSNNNSVTLKFVADDDMPTAGWVVELCEFHNLIPTTVTTDFLDSNTLFIKWNEMDPSTEWIFDYAIVTDSTFLGLPDQFNNPANFNTMLADTCYYEFYNVPVGSFLVYRIYTEDTSSCMRYCYGVSDPYSEEVECPCVLAENCQFDTVEGGVVLSWDYNPAVEYWSLSYMGIDTVVDGNVTEIFIPYDFPCYPPGLTISGNCTTYCKTTSLNFPMGGCHRTVGSIVRLKTTGSTVSIRWYDSGGEDDIYLLYMRLQGTSADNDVLVATFPHDVLTYTVTGLSPHTNYLFTMKVLCGGDTPACKYVTAPIATTLDNCIDFINLYDNENMYRTWGTYDNPLLYMTGSQGRHVPMLDSSQTDPNTGGLLRCVPPGEEVAFRLGDANVGAQAETINYDYEVDSLDKDMLVLRYAVVLQNPNHTAANQPHFSMEILDESGELVDTNCCYADFSAGGSLGWNSVEGSNVIWKDWSTVGIDIAPYHGQRIRIRFTTKDCADGGHFGYAYFTIRCDSKRIALVNLCDHTDSVRLRAPLGFEYEWTHGEDSTVISTENEIMVPVDSTVYRCHASFLGRPECSFEIQSIAILPKAVAEMHYKVDTCGRRLILYSDCRVDIDSAYLPYVWQTIDSVVWDVDGDVTQGDSAVVPLDGNRYYHIHLSCKLSESACYEEMTDSVQVDFFRQLLIVGDTEACSGDTVQLTGTFTDAGDAVLTWMDGSQEESFSTVVHSDTPVYAVFDFFNCTDTVYHNIVIHPVYNDTLVAHICRGDVYDTLGFNVNQTGFYTHDYLSFYGCDSVSNLNLSVFPTYEDTLFAAYCDSAYYDNGFEVDSTGFYTHSYTTVQGCDSVRHLQFVRHPVFRDTLVEEVCYGDTYIGYGFNESQSGFYQLFFTDVNGCDSVYSLDLNVVQLRFPNAVTPNGDGHNDLFYILGLLESKMFDYTALWVYDRWGRLIFSSENLDDLSDFWNPNTTHSPDGTYFYRFIARSLSHEITHKGFVEVIR